MNSSIIKAEFYSWAIRNGIEISQLITKPANPDIASPFDNLIIMNPKFETQVSYTYWLAHEFSHIIYYVAPTKKQAVHQLANMANVGNNYYRGLMLYECWLRWKYQVTLLRLWVINIYSHPLGLKVT